MMQNKNQSLITRINQPVIARSTATKQSIQKGCHPRFCRPQDSGISTLFSSSPLEGKGGTQCRVRGESFIFTAHSVTPTLRAAIYAGYSGHSGFTPCRHPELDSGSRCSVKKEEALNKSSFRAPLRSGFTLIELLVVILIIGILTAVAVPQYQLAVGRAQFSTLKATTRSLAEFAYVYYLEHGTYVGANAEAEEILPKGISCNIWDETQQDYIACWKKIFNTGTYFYVTRSSRKPALCLAWSTKTTDLPNKLCQKETGKTNGTCGSSYCEYSY